MSIYAYNTVDNDSSDIKIYCVYIIIYNGEKLGYARNYIGSTSVKKFNGGYFGSVTNKKFKDIWLHETKNHKELFEKYIISYHSTRREATYKERFIQKMLNVRDSIFFVNKAYATISKYYTLSGEDNPFYDKKHSDKTKANLSIKQSLNWKDDEYRKNQIARCNTPEAKEKKSKSLKAIYADKNNPIHNIDRTETVKKLQEGLRKARESEQFHIKLSNSIKDSWKNPNSKLNSIEYRELLSLTTTKHRVLLSPTGEEFIFDKAKLFDEFCKDNGLSAWALMRVARGECKAGHHKNWKCQFIKK